MRLPLPFYQLPVLFDAARLGAEVAGLPDAAWAPHPDGIPGNSAARLITVEGQENDAHLGRMRPTGWLSAMPYVRQALAGFGVVWSRARLMRLEPGVGVPEHADINYHWHTRVRLHIPVFTSPEVRFHCDGTVEHMGAGEAWIFDNWRRHHVENGSAAPRIHLVADTSGTAEFWRFALGQKPPRSLWPTVPWDPAADPAVLTERNERSIVMPAAEVQWLLDDLRQELVPQVDGAEGADSQARFEQLLDSFVCDWRQLCLLHGLSGEGLPRFKSLAMAMRDAARSAGEGLVMRTNGVSAVLVLEKRVLQHLLL
jgi:Aspartyl/Asparaginyl beta-hydroxylase